MEQVEKGENTAILTVSECALWVRVQYVCPFVGAGERPTGQIWDTQPSAAKQQKTKTRAATDPLRNISICDRMFALN